MSQSKSLIRTAVTLLFIGGTIAGLINVYGDNSDVEQLARRAACQQAECTLNLTSLSRSAIGQHFGFQATRKQAGKATRSVSVDVSCKRSFWLVGAYGCERTSGGFVEP